jgi:hypothetical protein
MNIVLPQLEGSVATEPRGPVSRFSCSVTYVISFCFVFRFLRYHDGPRQSGEAPEDEIGHLQVRHPFAIGHQTISYVFCHKAAPEP